MADLIRHCGEVAIVVLAIIGARCAVAAIADLLASLFAARKG